MVRTRNAVLPDVEHIHAIIQPYADEGTLLPRSILELCENVRDFVVAEEDGRIVGLSYYVVSGSNPPEGFAGPNDTWHQHIGLCLKYGVVIGPERWSTARCERAGGVKADGSAAWMVHAWVVPGWESAWGTFSGEHPELGAVVKH